MRQFFFLPKFILLGLFFILLWTHLYCPIILEIFILLIVLFFLFIFRRAHIIYQDTLKNNGEIYLSPVHGIIESIRHSVLTPDYPGHCHEIRISISIWNEKGLYLPTTGETTYLKANRGIKVHRNSPTHVFYGPVEEIAHTDLKFTSKNQTPTLMRFIDCTTGKRPTIWLKSGDRGRGGACFGHYPFGGTLLIYLPDNSDILVYEKERLAPGQTVIAALKDLPKG